MIKQLICLVFISGLLFSCVGKNTDQSENQNGQHQSDQDVDLKINKDIQENELTYSDTADEQPFPASEVDMEAYNREHGKPEFHFKRGLVLYKIKNFEEGILEFDTAISLAPKMASAYINRGKGLLETKNYQRAMLDFQKAVELDRSDTLAYLQLALAHYHLGDMESCIRVNNDLIQLNPRSAVGYFNRGTAYGKQNDFPKAIADFSKAVEIDPNYTDAHFNLGLAYYWSGDQAKACQNWAKARSLGSEKAARVIETYCK